MSQCTVLGVVVTVVEILERQSITYHLGGSFASTVHGLPRQTNDVDIVVDLSPGQGQRLAVALADGFYVDASVVADAVARRASFNAVHLATGFKVDFFVKGAGEYDDLELRRSIREQIAADPPRTAAVKSAEDTVLRKLQWFRDGGGVSDRQWGDVLGILKAQRNRLDIAYLEGWARRLDVLDLLARARADAE